MSKKLVRWAVQAIVAGCLVVGTVVLGAGTSAAGITPTPGPPQPPATTNGDIWTGG